MVLVTTSDSESNWYLHIFTAGSETPLRTLEYSHANDARRAVAALQPVFPQASFSEQIRD
ncbi:MAG: hypothetical protein HC876_18630 [Chloroflexaceae bacterium]|nr:hypothetical protein [Chloroflexaceae bacterium]NJO07361.1 hypothetical protein [Chloroflexaceae bacterium]